MPIKRFIAAVCFFACCATLFAQTVIVRTEESAGFRTDWKAALDNAGQGYRSPYYGSSARVARSIVRVTVLESTASGIATGAAANLYVRLLVDDRTGKQRPYLTQVNPSQLGMEQGQIKEVSDARATTQVIARGELLDRDRKPLSSDQQDAEFDAMLKKGQRLLAMPKGTLLRFSLSAASSKTYPSTANVPPPQLDHSLFSAIMASVPDASEPPEETGDKHCPAHTPLTLARILKAVEAHVPADDLASNIAACHVTFSLDAASLSQFADAHTPDQVLNVLDLDTRVHMSLAQAHTEVASLENRKKFNDASAQEKADEALKKLDDDYATKRATAAHVSPQGQFERTVDYQARVQKSQATLASMDSDHQIARTTLANQLQEQADKSNGILDWRIAKLRSAIYPLGGNLPIFSKYDPDQSLLFVILSGQPYVFIASPDRAKVMNDHWHILKAFLSYEESDKRSFYLYDGPGNVPVKGMLQSVAEQVAQQGVDPAAVRAAFNRQQTASTEMTSPSSPQPTQVSAQGRLTLRGETRAGQAPGGIAAGDLNGDGKLDLVTTNAGDGTISVLLNRGSEFSSPQAYQASAFPDTVALGDFNRDGKLDIAVANYNGGNVSIYLGNGDGTFQQQRLYNVMAGPTQVLVADVNHDGHLDLVVTSRPGNSVSVLLGDGHGTFGAPHNFPTGRAPVLSAVGDFNGDGIPDLAVPNEADGTVSILIGSVFGNGHGTFNTKARYDAGSGAIQAAVGDFNGDGKQDIAVINDRSNDVSLFLGAGDGTFQPQMRYPVGRSPHGVVAADFNGDGISDLAVTNQDSATVSMFHGQRNGQLSEPTTTSTCAVPVQPVAADLNGDGILDLAVACSASGTVAILLGH